MKRVIKPLSVVMIVSTCCALSFRALAGLEATCDGPGGYCSPGSRVTIRSTGGDNTVLPAMPWPGGSEKGFWLQYCAIIDGYPQCDGFRGDDVKIDLRPKVEPTPAAYSGNARWSDYINLYQGTWLIAEKSLRPGYNYCIVAFLTAGPSDPRSVFLNYGENTYRQRYSCVGYAPPPPPPELCSVNTGNQINIDFGSVERKEIMTTPGGNNDKNKIITVTCQGKNEHHINLRLSMTPVSWSDSLIATDNTALGISVFADGNQLKNNHDFSLSVNGSSSAILKFSLLRDPTKAVRDIATGPFQASASLIVSEP